MDTHQIREGFKHQQIKFRDHCSDITGGGKFREKKKPLEEEDMPVKESSPFLNPPNLAGDEGSPLLSALSGELRRHNILETQWEIQVD